MNMFYITRGKIWTITMVKFIFYENNLKPEIDPKICTIQLPYFRPTRTKIFGWIEQIFGVGFKLLLYKAVSFFSLTIDVENFVIFQNITINNDYFVRHLVTDVPDLFLCWSYRKNFNAD